MRLPFSSRCKCCLAALFVAGALSAANDDPVSVATLRERLVSAHRDSAAAMDHTPTPRLHTAALALVGTANRFDLLVARFAREGSLTVADLAAEEEAHGAAVAEYNEAVEEWNAEVEELLAGAVVDLPEGSLAAAAA